MLQDVAARDRPPLPKRVGTGALRGRVVDGETGRALPRARVRISGPGIQRPSVLTDEQGVFTFAGLPAGSFFVNADKPTYMYGSYPEAGRTIRTASGARLVLGDGEARDNVVIRLYRGSAITGRVVDAHGDPVESAQVAAIAVNASGAPRQGSRSTGQTNDIGEFRLPRLAAGRYIVMVTPMMGRFQDPPTVEPVPAPQPTPTYYPSVPSKADAQVVQVVRGQPVTGVDVVMLEDMPTLLRGRVISADGDSVPSGGAYLSIRADDRDAAGPMGGAPIRPDGTFSLLVAPGDYIVEVRRMLPQTAGTNGAGRPNEQYGVTKVTVAGETTDVSVVMGAGATASGRVIFEGTTPPPSPPANATVPLGNQRGLQCRAGELHIAADWTFTVEGLMGTCTAPGSYLFGRWMLKSVTIDNREMKNGSMTFEPGRQYGNVQIVVSDQRTELNLHVTDEGGQPTREYVVILFPQDKIRWDSPQSVRTFVPPSPQNVEAMQRAAAGNPARLDSLSQMQRELIAGVMTGDYYAIALDDIAFDDSRDPEILERLAGSASRVTVSDGATDLPLVRFRLADIVR